MTRFEPRPSYSQFGEDRLIADFLREPKGFYVDVGAFDPWNISNTALLFERGWRGINIDADAGAIERFRQERPDDINLNVGVGLARGELDLFAFEVGAVNTFDPRLADRWVSVFGQPRTVKVPVLPLSDILAEHMPEGVRIDLLDVDCEGLDEEVIRSNDWERFRPRVVCVEIHRFAWEAVAENPVYKYLRERDYILMGHYYVTSIFRAREEP
jgi:FkbM family methyltransferase